MENPYQKICLALDVPTADEALALVTKIKKYPIWLKVGITLWNSKHGGHTLIHRIKDLHPEAQIFLDLKLHDIPYQMQGALKSLEGLGVDLVTIHSASGPAHISQCVETAQELGIGLLAITVLTSVSEKEHKLAGHKQGIVQTVIRRAQRAKSAGACGVVCSAQEVENLITLKTGIPLMLVTPGIRPWETRDDQCRVMGPAEAIKAGSDLLVIGRPIRKPPNHIGTPENALNAIAEMIALA